MSIFSVCISEQGFKHTMVPRVKPKLGRCDACCQSLVVGVCCLALTRKVASVVATTIGWPGRQLSCLFGSRHFVPRYNTAIWGNERPHCGCLPRPGLTLVSETTYPSVCWTAKSHLCIWGCTRETPERSWFKRAARSRKWCVQKY